MDSLSDPARYEAWYHTPRGRWVSDSEFRLLKQLRIPRFGETLLDVGCGTGHFSRRFAKNGYVVTGIDPDLRALRFAEREGGAINYLQGALPHLPFEDNRFDVVTSIASLCFVEPLEQALQEMWRVARHALLLGLLNRHSLLYRQRHGHASYRSARWDSAREIRKLWITLLRPTPDQVRLLSALYLPSGNPLARGVENWLPHRFLWGGFLVVALHKG